MLVAPMRSPDMCLPGWSEHADGAFRRVDTSLRLFRIQRGSARPVPYLLIGCADWVGQTLTAETSRQLRDHSDNNHATFSVFRILPRRRSDVYPRAIGGRLQRGPADSF